MIKKLLVFIFLVFSSVSGYANGGPTVGVSYINLSPLDDYLGDLGISPFGNYYYMLGGMGTNWFTENFGVGFQLAGGTRMNFKEGFDAYASITMVQALINLENIVYKSKTDKTLLNLKFGPGFKSTHFILVTSGASTEFTIDSIMFFAGMAMQVKFSEAFKLELSLSYNFAPSNRWIKQKGSAAQPPDTNLDTTEIVISVRFGS
jgi:hypothetical protein